MEEQRESLESECRRQSESCLYTSTTFYIWLRRARFWRRFFVVAPVILGAAAGWSVLDNPSIEWLSWITAACALGAGIFPALFVALDMNMSIDEIARLASEFKSLQDRFRIAADVKSKGDFNKFEQIVEDLMDRLDAARASSTTPPEKYFKEAQKKVTSKDYEFKVDTD